MSKTDLFTGLGLFMAGYRPDGVETDSTSVQQGFLLWPPKCH